MPAGTSDALRLRMTRVLLPALLAGCAATTSYVYAPRDASTSQAGYPTAIIGIPPDGPKGRLELTSYGITDIQPEGTARMTVLHVHISVANERDAAAWTFVPSQQTVQMARKPAEHPIFVSSDKPDVASLTIAPGERRQVDLYYALPAGIASEEDLPGFELTWRVGASSARTHFERVEEEKMSEQFHPIFKHSEEPYWWYGGRVVVLPHAHR